MFSFKDRTPDALKSMVVYQFTCAGCNSCYIGETSRHFSTRIKEHTMRDKNWHIFKHFSQFPSCRGMSTPSCFRILDSGNSSINLNKQAYYISKNKPDLNKQLHHFNPFLRLFCRMQKKSLVSEREFTSLVDRSLLPWVVNFSLYFR